MASPAQIRSERKIAVRAIKNSLRTLDSITDKLDRRLAQILRVKKMFPDSSHAEEILTYLRQADKQLDNVLDLATAFSSQVGEY